jgi:phage repressor protein C with HTH and peptisase S24 domain
MSLPDFATFFKRVKQVTPIQNQSQLAQELGLGRAAVSLVKHKDVIPSKWIFALARTYDLNADWLATGAGTPTASEHESGETQPARVVNILPRLNKDRSPVVRSHSDLPESAFDFWLEPDRLSSRLAVMTMVGTSMEPEIKPGDRLLIDLNDLETYSDCTYAVGIDSHILVRRVEKMPGQLVLRCHNSNAPDMFLSEDDQKAVSIVGRIIWVGRRLPTGGI